MTTSTPTLNYTGPGSAPGWYADPIRPSRQRYYDGADWTNQVCGDVGRSSSTGGGRPGSPLRAAQSRVQSLSRRASTVVVLVSLVAVGYFSWVLVFSNYWGELQQSNLRHEFNALMAKSPNASAASVSSSPPPVPAIPPTNAVVGVIQIPKIGVNDVFTSGTGDAQLAKGPGLWQAGAFPGTPGNATISGHRTTYGAYFRHLDELVPGDLIYIIVPGQPTAVFQVRAAQAVLPSDVAVTAPTGGVRLTLTTCNPPYSASQRLVVQAEEIKGAWASHATPASQWKFS